MRCAIYDPEITTTVVVDTYDNVAGIKYAANSSMEFWNGTFYLAFDGETAGYTERSSAQRIWMVTSTDGVTWSAPFQPFRDAAYCNNPMVTTPHEQQPNLVNVGDELWCLWNGQDTYVSKLTSPTGKWTNSRLEYLGGEQAFSSSTLAGAATGGRIRYPVADGITDWTLYIAGDPIILSSGVIACPATFLSAAHYSDQIVTSNFFTKALKYNALLTTTDGVEWSISRISNGACGDYTAWEPYLVENPVGQVTVFTRNVDYANTDITQFVAHSFDGGKTFTSQVPSKVGVPSSRGAARQAGLNRWLLAHCDHPSDGGNNDRSNGALWMSRRGLDDFVPGVNFSGFGSYVKYPSILIKDGISYITYTTGLAGSNAAGKGRTLLRLTTVPIPEDLDAAYISPRKLSEFSTTAVSDPALVSAAPAHYDFNGYSDRVVSADTVTTSGGLTFMAWIKHDYDPPFNAALIDIRSGLTGSLMRACGAGIGSVDVWHGLDMPIEKPIFTASVIDPTAMTVTAYVCYGQSDFLTKTSYFKSLLFTGQPSNTETVTIDGTVYTFKNSPAGGTDVQIGASAAATAANLRAAINTAMGTNNNCSTFNLDTRLVVAKTSGATFTATSGASNVTVETSVSLSGGVANIGCKRVGSSIPSYHGSIYDARIYDSALSVANMRSLYNARRAEFGYGTEISGTSTAPSSPLMRLNPASPDAVAFPSLGNTVSKYEVIDDQLRLHGEASASVELPYGATQFSIRYKLSATPTSTDKYVIASFGLSATPVRLYFNGANPKNLYLNGILVGTVADPTAWNEIVAIIAANKAIVAGIDYYFEGKPRCYLGNAWPENLLASSKHIDFEVSAMSVSRA